MNALRGYLESELRVRIAEFLGGPTATDRATAAAGVIGGLIFARYLSPIRSVAALPPVRCGASSGRRCGRPYTPEPATTNQVRSPARQRMLREARLSLLSAVDAVERVAEHRRARAGNTGAASGSGSPQAWQLRSPRERAHNEAQLRSRVVQLWQTRVLRTEKLTVRDEIENALSYYASTVLTEIPKLYADLEALLERPVAPFFRMGNWIGGDRDGNPNVDATTLDIAVRRHSEIAFRHYLTEVHQLGAELSISLTLAPCSPALQALAERSGDDSSHRADEPYRRALTGIIGAGSTAIQPPSPGCSIACSTTLTS